MIGGLWFWDNEEEEEEEEQKEEKSNLLRMIMSPLVCQKKKIKIN